VPLVGLVALIGPLLFASPQLRGDVICPSAAEVGLRLSPLLPNAPTVDAEGTAPDVVELVSKDGGTVVRMWDAAGSLSHQRELPVEASCAERAAQAAVLIAAWEADLHADVTFPPVVARAPPALPPAVAARRESAPPPEVSAISAARVAGPPSLDLAVGGELFVAAPPAAGVAPASAVEATWSGGGRVRGRLALMVTGTHGVRLTPGAVSWRRAALGAGVMFNLVRRRARLDLRADALGAAVIAQGSGFSADYGATSWQVGGDVALRVSLPLGPRFAIWADLAAANFLGKERLSVLNVSTTPVLPAWEVQGGLGASFSLAP
jgi:hypothetical protein